MLSMIAAESENHVIGKDNQLIWRIPTDTAYFKKTTLGHAIIMGRKTFDSIQKALPKRRNLVVSRDPMLKIPGAEVFTSLELAIAACDPQEESFIVGGGELYREGLKFADRIYLTKVHTFIEGDSYFPELPKGEWKLLSNIPHKANDQDEFDFSFLIYERLG